jgi:hypothetical protein
MLIMVVGLDQAPTVKKQGKREEVMIDEKFLKEVSIAPPSR